MPTFDGASGTWTLSDPDQVEEVLTDPRFQVRPPGEPVPAALAGTSIGRIVAELARFADGDRHWPRRALVERFIGRFDVPEIESATKATLRALAAEEVDAHGWITAVSPLTLARLIGIGSDGVAEHVAVFARAISPGATDADIEAGIPAAEALWATVEPVASRFTTAGTTTDTVTANLIGLLFQGLDSVAALLGLALIELAKQPEPMDSRVVIRRIVHATPPIRNTRRFASEDVTVGDIAVKAGDALVIDLDAATRAAAPGPGFAFGAGGHRCPGQVLAFTLAATALTHGPRLSHLPDPVRWFPYPNARVPDMRGIPLVEQAT